VSDKEVVVVTRTLYDPETGTDREYGPCQQCRGFGFFEDWGFCRRCMDRYGHHLLKSTIDPFEYAIRLTSGDLIYYQEAAIKGDWVVIPYDGFTARHHGEGVPPRATDNPPWERGLQIHVDAIAWCADAPFGS
jgi:hypothetical protein